MDTQILQVCNNRTFSFFFQNSKISISDGTQNTLHGHFSPNDVHHQFGIALTTPVFTNFHNVTSTVEAQMYLFKKSDGQMSEPVPFYFHPKEEQEERKPVIVAVRQNAAARPKRDR